MKIKKIIAAALALTIVDGSFNCIQKCSFDTSVIANAAETTTTQKASTTTVTTTSTTSTTLSTTDLKKSPIREKNDFPTIAFCSSAFCSNRAISSCDFKE